MSSRGVVHFVICFLLLFGFLLAGQKSFVFKSSDKESRWSRYKGKLMNKTMKLGKYFTARPPLDVNASDVDRSLLHDIPEEVQFDPCSTSEQLCLNGGKCTNDRGKFYCNCGEKHYGRRCELVANKAACTGHLCKNGAICYSTPDSQKVLKRDKLTTFNEDLDTYKKCRNDKTKSADECERMKKEGKEPTREDFDDISRTVYYRCQCLLGFQGQLCDYTREERLCDEDFCMGHGYAISKGGECSCACEPDYTGEHCETLLPCSAFPCHNEGICKDEYNEADRTFTARCQCPELKGLMGLNIAIEGEHCEKLTLNDGLLSLNPCGNVHEYFTAIKQFEAKNKDDYKFTSPGFKNPDNSDTNHVLAETIKNEICGLVQNCDSFTVSICNNLDGVCGVAAGFLPLMAESTSQGEGSADSSGRVIFPLPRCVCPLLYTGRLCDQKLETLCHPTTAEEEDGITFENRCTSENHGTCSVNENNERFCVCHDDFVGQKCEIYSPCARKPCGLNAECIPLPFEQSLPGEQSYRCICEVGDEQNGNQCIYNGKGKCAGKENPCNHGKCVSCPDTSGDESSICNDDEQNRGFRCICAPGFAPPLCLAPYGPCEAHLCLNGGICKVNEEHTYDCSCAPGTTGDYCDTISDYCEFVGNRKCGNTGKCSNTNESIRGFLCSCEWEYRGADCELFVGKLAGFYQMFDENYMYSYPIAAVFLCEIFLILAEFICGDRAERRRRRKRGERTSVSTTNPPSKVSKTSNSSKKAEGPSGVSAPEIPIVVAAVPPLTPLPDQQVPVPIPSTPPTATQV